MAHHQAHNLIHGWLDPTLNQHKDHLKQPDHNCTKDTYRRLHQQCHPTSHCSLRHKVISLCLHRQCVRIINQSNSVNQAIRILDTWGK